MRISAIIPTLNEEELLPYCLDSIINQTHPPDEIIVVDAGSTDRTLEIARKYKVKIIELGTANVAYQREVGAKHAMGDVILSTDADTILNDKFIENALHHLENPDISAVVGAITPINKNPITHINCLWRDYAWSICQRGCAIIFKKPQDEELYNGYYEPWQDINKLKKHLQGRVIYDPNCLAVTDIPTGQQVETVAWLGALVGGLYIIPKIIK